MGGTRAYATGTVIRRQQAEGPQPAVVLTPDWLGHYTFRAYRSFVEQLARQGVLVLFLDNPHSGRRHAPYAGLYATAAAAGTQVAGIQVFDALRGFDYLLTRADVDAGKIGIAGLGEGALRAYLAAALEPRFQFVIAVAGTTTYGTLVQAAAEGQATAQPAAFVSGLLEWTDIDRVAACLAPRPVLIAGGAGRWPAAGGEAVLGTMQAVYRLYDAQDRISQVPGEAVDDMTPYAAGRDRVAYGQRAPSLKASTAAPAACTEPAEMDFQLLGYLQRRIESQAASRLGEPLTEAAWQTHRQAIIAWLRTACAMDAKPALDDKVLDTAESGDLVTERLALGVDADFRCPAVLVRPASAAGKCAGVILSHDDRQCYAAARITDAARRLAAAGYWVIVPEHASVHAQSLQPLGVADQPSFYGDEAGRLYGPADAVGRPPLALRVCEDLAAFRYLASRAEVDAAQIVVAGSGVGGVDACLAALLEDRIAGVAAVDVTTMRDWAVNVAPGELHFFHLMPYLPSLLTRDRLGLRLRRPGSASAGRRAADRRLAANRLRPGRGTGGRGLRFAAQRRRPASVWAARPERRTGSRRARGRAEASARSGSDARPNAADRGPGRHTRRAQVACHRGQRGGLDLARRRDVRLRAGVGRQRVSAADMELFQRQRRRAKRPVAHTADLPQTGRDLRADGNRQGASQHRRRPADIRFRAGRGHGHGRRRLLLRLVRWRRRGHSQSRRGRV